MKNMIVISIGLLMVTALCFAQQSKLVAELPAKGTLLQTSANGDAVIVTEGKKGLNAVNVKQAENVNENGRTTTPNGQDDGTPFPLKSKSITATKYPCMNPSLVDSTNNNLQNKHAINTKGTSATRNK